MFVAYKYGHIRLGETSDKPEFSNLTYFSMIITAGACNSLVVCSVQEPMIHQQHHFFAQSGYRSQDELDMFAINITLVDWGVGSWAVLTVVAIALSLATYRLRLPLIFRSCFYPILGHYTWGWIGDFIDGFTIVVSMFPVIASLGTAGMHLVAGFLYLGWVDELHTDDYLTSIQNVVVWTVTIFSLISVISGIHGGVKIVCLLAISLATLSTFLVFILDDMKFLLNLQVQGTGLYLQTGIFQLNFWTDAFGQLREGSGRAIDGNSSVQTWMQSWFNFSLSWWCVFDVSLDSL